MKQHIHALHHIGIPTSDMDKTIAFYQGLGADIVYQKMVEENGQMVSVTLIDFFGTMLEFYLRDETAMRVGAIDHLAFKVDHIMDMYETCKKNGYRLMEECADEIGLSPYWPNQMKWFIVYGPNEEKIEFSEV